MLVRTISQDYLACVIIAPFPLLLFCPIVLSTVLSTVLVLSMINRDTVLRLFLGEVPIGVTKFTEKFGKGTI